MEVHPDFRELLALFNAHSVEYMIVGGYALAFHGAPRFTGDLDIFVRPTAQNAGRILAALNNFGFGSLNLGVEDFSTQDRVIQLGVPPVRVDPSPRCPESPGRNAGRVGSPAHMEISPSLSSVGSSSLSTRARLAE